MQNERERGARALRRALRAGAVVALVLSIAAIGTDLAWSFSFAAHDDITDELKKIKVRIRGRDETFTEAALAQIRDANRAVDDLTPAAVFSGRHFTDDAFVSGSVQLLAVKRLIVNSLEKSTAAGGFSRTALGNALHAIQDFYSHSTWVESGRTTVNDTFGRSVYANPGPGELPCPADPNLVQTRALSSAYFQGLAGCNSLGVPGFPDEVPPGKCFHGNYNFSDFGQTPCIGMNKDLRPDEVAAMGLTSALGPTYAGKHNRAVALAKEASLDFVEQILDELRGDDEAILRLLGLEGSVYFAIDTSASMGNPLKVSPSGRTPLEGVQAGVRRIVQYLESRPNRVPEFGVVPFADAVSDSLISNNAGTALLKVDSLVGQGGLDCPESSMAALLQAIETSLDNSMVILFTDAEAKDGSLADEVIRKAKSKRIRVTIGVIGGCVSFCEFPDPQGVRIPPRPGQGTGALPIDPAYLRVAEQTGGRAFQVGYNGGDYLSGLIYDDVVASYPAPAQQPLTEQADVLEAAAEDAASTVTEDRGRLLQHKGRLSPLRDATVPFVVDRSASRLEVNVAIGADPRVMLRNPSGEAVMDGVDGATVNILSAGQMIIIDSPSPGTWNAEIGGSGEFSVEARVTSSVQFAGFDFVRPTKDLHGGYYPIAEEPTIGSADTRGEAKLRGDVASAQFTLESEGGVVLAELSLAPSVRGANRGTYHGAVALPSEPFKVVVSGQLAGQTAEGAEYRREFPTVYRARTLSVEVMGYGLVEAAPGTSATIEYAVTNHGASGMFQMSAMDDLGFVTGVTPAQVSLDLGETATVRVNIRIGTDAEDRTITAVRLLASGQVSEASNAATVRVQVIAPEEP